MRRRWARADDAAAVTRLVNAAYAVEQFFVRGDRVSMEVVKGLIADSAVLVATDDDADDVTACVHIEIRGDRGYFGMLAVDPVRQGAGLGRALIAAAEGEARRAGCRAMDIKVVNLRGDLLHFYGRLGYRPTGTEPYVHRPVIQACHFVCLEKPLEVAEGHEPAESPEA